MFLQLHKKKIYFIYFGVSVLYAGNTSYFQAHSALNKYKPSMNVSKYKYVSNNICPIDNMITGLMWPCSLYKNMIAYFIVYFDTKE